MRLAWSILLVLITLQSCNWWFEEQPKQVVGSIFLLKEPTAEGYTLGLQDSNSAYNFTPLADGNIVQRIVGNDNVLLVVSSIRDWKQEWFQIKHDSGWRVASTKSIDSLKFEELVSLGDFKSYYSTTTLPK